MVHLLSAFATGRSAFDADFKDSKGFGWATDSPPLDFKLLMEKKVRRPEGQ